MQALGASLRGAKTTALFKSVQFEVIRIVLRAGKSIPRHKVPGEVIIQCMEGEATPRQYKPNAARWR